MKNKKILFIPIVGFSIILLVGVLIPFIFGSESHEYASYDKYSLAITIDAKKGDTLDDQLIDVSYDGENARINSNKVDKDSYIIGERIYYLEDDTFYWYRVENSYLDIYGIISSYEIADLIKEVDGTEYYGAVIEAKQTNELLKALFIDDEVSTSTKASYSVIDDRISDFSITFNDVMGYDELNINIVAKRLQDDYEVNTSRIFGSVGGGRRYKVSEAMSNIFAFGGTS